MATRHLICPAREIPVGGRKIVEVAGLSVGIFNVAGAFHALRNRCPHQGAPLCLGSVKGMALPSRVGEYLWAREGEILRCPWHGWEFDLLTGRSVCDPSGVRVKAYEITVEQPKPQPDGVAEIASTVDAGRTGEAAKDSADTAEPLIAETYRVTVEDQWLVLHL